MLRNDYFSEEFLIFGPFNLDAVQFQGGTISGTEQEMHELGQSLVEALGQRSTAKKGKWDVEVGLPCHQEKRGEKEFMACISPNGKVIAEFAVRKESEHWILDGSATEALSSIEAFHKALRDKRRRLQSKPSSAFLQALQEIQRNGRQKKEVPTTPHRTEPVAIGNESEVPS